MTDREKIKLEISEDDRYTARPVTMYSILMALVFCVSSCSQKMEDPHEYFKNNEESLNRALECALSVDEIKRLSNVGGLVSVFFKDSSEVCYFQENKLDEIFKCPGVQIMSFTKYSDGISIWLQKSDLQFYKYDREEDLISFMKKEKKRPGIKTSARVSKLWVAHYKGRLDIEDRYGR